MKNILRQWVILTALVIISYHTTSQTIRTVGSGGNYATLQAAFDAINAGTITGEIELQIISNTTETSTTEATAPTLNANGSGSANYTSVAIYPTGAGGFTIATADFYQLIILNGADNVTIDGRVNRTGTTIALTLEHQHTTSNRARTIEFRNSAENNTIRYSNIRSSLRASASGVIHFAGTDEANGNNNNVIEYCDITHTDGSRTRHLLYSNGQGASNPNAGNIIRFNYFYNFMNSSEYNSSLLSTAINLMAHTSNWIITENSFYETTNFAPTDAMSYVAIRVSTEDYHNTITNNYIGGRLPQCGGSKWHTKSTAAHRFTGIYYSSSSTTNSSVIHNNTISNFDYESTSTDTWRGIDVHSLSANTIEISNNSIGTETGTGSINVGSSVGAAMNTIGIRLFGPGHYTVSDNLIGSINASAHYFQDHNLYGIIKSSGSANLIVSGNLICNSQTAFGHLSGIEIGGNGGFATVENNTIRDLTSTENINKPNTSSIIGILITSTAVGTEDWHNIDDNKISNLSTNSRKTDILTLAGIALNTSGNIKRRIRRNTIFNLSSTETGDPENPVENVHVTGIYHSAGASTIGNGRVSENFIHTLNLATISDNATATGIRINGGRAEYFNNIINIGGSLSGGYNVYGILHTGDRYNRYYFNTVHIGGSVTGGNNTFAFNKSTANGESSAFNDDLRNNIFSISRTNASGSAKHYAISLPGTTRLTINYNNYYAPNIGGILGYLGGDQTSLADWKVATSQDNNSLNTDPQFANAGGTDASDYIPAATLTGQSITGFTTDYFGNTRSTNEMGALLKSYVVWTGATDTDWATNTNWKNNNAPVTTSNVIIPAVTNDPVIASTGNTINSLIVEVNGKLTVTNTGTLTVSNNVNNIRGADGLVIKSGASGTGSLIHSTDGVDATFERYLPGAAGAWHMISAPVLNMNIGSSNWNPAADEDLYMWYEPGIWVNFKNQDGSGGDPTFPSANGNNQFGSGRGYIVNYNQANIIKTFSGSLQAGDVSVTLAKSSQAPANWPTGQWDAAQAGWNLIGNPFPSGLNWDAVTKTALAENWAQVYNPANASYSQVSAIAPGQGFFVLAQTDNAILTLGQSNRVHGGTFLKQDGITSENMLLLALSNDKYADEARVFLNDASMFEHDFFDASKLFSFNPEVPQLYTHASCGRWLAINSVPSVPDQDGIPLSIMISQTENLSISLSAQKGAFADQTIILYDKKTGLDHNLSQNTTFSFFADKEDNERFLIKFSALSLPAIPKPGQLHAFFHDGHLHLMNPSTGKVDVEVYNAQGQMLLSIKVNEGMQKIAFKPPSGIYLLRLMSNDYTATGKVYVR